MDKNDTKKLSATERRLIIRPIITVLLTALFVGLLIKSFYGLLRTPSGKMLSTSYFVLAAAGLLLLIGSLLRTLYVYRDYKAEKAGEKRRPAKSEKTLPLLFYALAIIVALAASIIGAYAMTIAGN